MKPTASINARILRLRQTLNLSQESFAKALNISRPYQGRIEQTGQKVNDRIISLICLTFKVSDPWLRHGTGTMFENTANPRLAAMTKGFEKLAEPLQDFLLEQLNLALAFQSRTVIKVKR